MKQTAPKRRELEREVLAWIGEGASRPADEERFAALALALFELQYTHNEPYRRLCDAFGRPPERVSSWREIPAVPSGAFKEARLACFPPEACVRTFRTSGSSSERRGELHLDTLELYEASLLATFGAFVCAGDRPRLLVLAPDTTDAPDSSLSYMFACAVRELGASGSCFLVDAHGWRPELVIAALEEALESEAPLALVGTAFAFVYLLDALAERGSKLDLGPGSRVMETGGFKGRTRELARDELHGAIEDRLGVARARIINQYGMCELQSQFYEPTLTTGRPTSHKHVPPWVRSRVVDPATVEDVPRGEAGVLIHYDLANTGQVLAVQTSDLGRSHEDGFEVIGRIPGAEARGCSLAADVLLGASA